MYIYIYIYIYAQVPNHVHIFDYNHNHIYNEPKCMSCHKAIVMIIGRVHCFHNICIYI